MADDSADMLANGAEALRSARSRLESALSRLESRVGPMASRLTEADAKLSEADAFKADRLELAERLDAATAEVRTRDAELSEIKATLQSREAEFAKLAGESGTLIDTIVSQVQRALGDMPDARGG